MTTAIETNTTPDTPDAAAAETAAAAAQPATPSAEPTISVIVPIFNTEQFLDQALSSIEAQTFEDFEVICLNDGSTDSSLAIMQEHAARDSRIRIIDKQNQGYGASCNRGLDEAHGRYIAIVEPDDWILPKMFERMIAYANTFKEEIDVIKTPYWRIKHPDTPQQRVLNCSYRGRINPPSQPFVISDAAHLLEHHPSIWSALYRRAFLFDHSIRFHEIPGAGWADNPFLVETLCQARTIVYLDEPFYCYREETKEKSRNFHRKNPLLPLERWSDMMDVLDRLHVTDPRILRAHYSRGFTYLGGILQYAGMEAPGVRDAATAMFNRMDESIVMEDPQLSPNNKALYRELRGLEPQHVSALPYLKSLINEGLYSLKNTGVKNTLDSVLSYFEYKDVRSGR